MQEVCWGFRNGEGVHPSPLAGSHVFTSTSSVCLQERSKDRGISAAISEMREIKKALTSI